jgi:hypothetical protein
VGHVLLLLLLMVVVKPLACPAAGRCAASGVLLL